MASTAEQQFRDRFPNTRVTVEPSGLRGRPKVTVYAGDYLCALSLVGRDHAFRLALERVERGIINPNPEDPSKVSDRPHMVEDLLTGAVYGPFDTVHGARLCADNRRLTHYEITRDGGQRVEFCFPREEDAA